ncbi:TIGR00730 family Rossman fold protein [Terrimonas rubra]|uniref:Cytokinin riboside 5'-monophosphate phosphoribohydrolase n=1 Tax=Terrimonas rubra TaxID=1035890 RepID=A0ABW6A5V0_9BACT
MLIQSLAVFCGSKNGNNELFATHTKELGALMAQHHIALVYGGGSVGIMGIIADSVMQNGGKVVGIIPQILVNQERQHKNITELLVVEDMHIRKRKMYDLADAAIILPGGFGTLDELFEMVTWNQLSIHDKQIFLLNSDGFYDHLIAHIYKMKEEGFLYQEAFDRITVLNEPKELIEYFNPMGSGGQI